MGDLIERLRREARLSIPIPSCDESALEAAVVDLAALAHQAAEEIITLRAENARLTEERDALVEHITELSEHVRIRIKDGDEMNKRVWRIALEDVLSENFAALAKVKGAPDAR